ncbi:hypothetical protein GGR56DRAFT_674892 [Xylariaceae sp. FL0804]|nr:hypothetical protein GGR56DRAFT_674892 [Xylariaceae sp. FL0804]
MAIIEVALPQFKKRSPEEVKAVGEKAYPLMLKGLKEGGALNIVRGWVVAENDKDVSEDLREIALLEWPAASDFHSFIASPGFKEVTELIKPLTAGPPTLHLVEEAGNATRVFRDEGPLEVLLVSPKDASDAAARQVLERVTSVLPKISGGGGGPGAVAGSTVNHDKKEIVAVVPFASKEELDETRKSAARAEALASIGGLAEVTSLVVRVEFKKGIQ